MDKLPPKFPAGVQDPQQLLDPPYSYVAYGPDANCTLEICPIILSVYQYQPSIAAQAVFIALFGISALIHLYQGIRWRTWTFMGCVVTGCICELIGYPGRITLHDDPFSFNGFLIQIICITFAPVFMTAAIYFTLAKIVNYLGPQYARFPAKFYYWVFIPCDVISLVLQAIGGAESSQSTGDNSAAVSISIAGLSFQVFTLCVFISLSLEFAWRYYKATKNEKKLPTKFRVFVAFLSGAIVLILIRCIYRIDELSDGYSGPLIHNEGLFIGLEGVMIIVAAFFLNVAHPGPVFPRGEVLHVDEEPAEEMREDDKV
ncbi:uncharacterized protein KY384_009206 [Bacidia gigantensis]|uniref:uncharacterized protein n=1 Tax=Bacidia gigantensis TaxID=2732470 RepID=UPI001D052388|nr:uncharacterized protein KY384_009206 [Bacidia gigantensis]KAG8525562.1 hypothetical protein KY384_009206 [Bacidia gigantensis]